MLLNYDPQKLLSHHREWLAEIKNTYPPERFSFGDRVYVLYPQNGRRFGVKRELGIITGFRWAGRNGGTLLSAFVKLDNGKSDEIAV